MSQPDSTTNTSAVGARSGELPGANATPDDLPATGPAQDPATATEPGSDLDPEDLPGGSTERLDSVEESISHAKESASRALTDEPSTD